MPGTHLNRKRNRDRWIALDSPIRFLVTLSIRSSQSRTRHLLVLAASLHIMSRIIGLHQRGHRS